jgi:hypothetical protein
LHKLLLRGGEPFGGAGYLQHAFEYDPYVIACFG